MVYIGLISYSLYLWHWGILSISRWTIGIHWWSVPFQVLLMFGLAIASYRYIETPFRKGNWLGKRWKNLAVGGGVIITLSGGLFTLDKPLKGKLFTGDQYNKWNMKIFSATKIINDSMLPTVYLFGDSHAGHYGVVMTDLAGKKNFNLITHPNGEGLKRQMKNRSEFITAALQTYKNNFKKGDIIIFAAHKGKYYGENQNWIKLYSTFIKQTQNIGLKFILISPTPTFSGVKNGYTCQKEWYRPSWAISPSCFEEIKKREWFASNAVSIDKIQQFLLANPEVSYLDAFSIVCPDPYCKNHDQLSNLYKDKHHLSSYGAMKVSNAIETFIRSK